jgi:hypothetical protein
MVVGFRLGRSHVNIMFHVFVKGKEGCEGQMVPSMAEFQG